MKVNRRAAVLCWLLWMVPAAAAAVLAAEPAKPLSQRVESVLETPGYKSAHWGLLVVDAKTGETVYERNADQMFCPASVTKLYSCAAALLELGPDHRFVTPVVRRGEIDKDGVLKGDLILVAQGDLSLGGRAGADGQHLFVDGDHTYAGGNLTSGVVSADPLAGLDHLARRIRESGIQQVTGDLIIDDRLFETITSTGSGPSQVTPILLNDNVIDVVATPGGSAGEPCKIRLMPSTEFAAMDAAVETVAAGEKTSLVVETVGPRRFRVRGKIPVGHAPVVKIYEVDDPASFARTALIERLRARGVKITTSHLGSNDRTSLPSAGEVAKLPKVAEFTSSPFREAIRVILKVSHNLHASTLPMLVAAHKGERGFSAGMKRQGELLKELGVDVSAISFGGGAGGSRADLVTPRATVALLKGMMSRPEFPAYEAGLPVLGRDGTLAKAIAADSPARGHARAKTGTYTISNSLTGRAVLLSKALAGYLESADGRTLIFTFFVNNVPIPVPSDSNAVNERTLAAGQLLGKLCEVFYESSAAEGNR